MVMLTNNSSAILTPAEVADLVVNPVLTTSTAAQVCSVVKIQSHDYRVPVAAKDPSAAWVAEGTEIPVSDAQFNEITVTPQKLAGLTVISSELANDSSPAAAEAVGAGLVRDISRKLDAAFFGGDNADPAPDGIAALTGVSLVAMALDNTDPFEAAIASAEGANATLRGFVMNPADMLALAQLKKATGSNESLLAPDPSKPTGRMIAGVPIYVTTAVAKGTIWGIPDGLATLVVRQDASVVTDTSAFFTSDRVAVRATMRVGWALPHPASVVKIDAA